MSKVPCLLKHYLDIFGYWGVSAANARKDSVQPQYVCLDTPPSNLIGSDTMNLSIDTDIMRVLYRWGYTGPIRLPISLADSI